jgi:hypothetical protein
MKLFKLFFISVITFVAFFTLVGLLFPNKIVIVKGEILEAKTAAVSANLQNFSSWKNWHPFFSDAEKANIIDNSNATINTNSVNIVLQQFKNKANNIEVIATYGKHKTTTEIVLIPLNNDSTSTQIVWKETEDLKWYPWERFRGLLLEGAKGNYVNDILFRYKKYLTQLN